MHLFRKPKFDEDEEDITEQEFEKISTETQQLRQQISEQAQSLSAKLLELKKAVNKNEQ